MHVETIIVGGGQAGLATSYHLTLRGREHVVLERAARVGHAWRAARWDSFTLVTPNWSFRLPGAEYDGDAPGAYMPRDEIVARLERYAERYRMPIHPDTEVRSVQRREERGDYLVETDGGDWEARNVVVATGLYQKNRIPPYASGIDASIAQVPSGHYRNPQALEPGGVLVVGTGQSGCQIAEELYRAGRTVYLSVGGAGRVPRRYRGRDAFDWLHLAGFFDRTPGMLPSPHARFAPIPHVTGQGGGRTLNLHRFARDGVVLLGHLREAREGRVWLAPDLAESLTRADEIEAQLTGLIDAYIAGNGLDAPPESLPRLRDGYPDEEVLDLDLHAAGVSTVIWAAGHTFDYSLVRLPILDADGYPVQTRGATAYPGLYVVGLPWLTKFKSGLFLGVGEDAEAVATAIDEAGRKDAR